MSVISGLSGRAWAVAGGVVAAAAVSGAAVGLVGAQGEGGSRGLVPELAQPTPSATPAATPTPSATPSPTASATPSPTPSATPSPAKTAAPTPKPTPTATTPTPKPTPSATATPRTTATVVIRNTSTVGAQVTINGGTWTVPSGGSKTVEVTPEGAGHDAVAVTDTEHPTCGRGDSDWYFEAGRTFTLSITPSRDCRQGNESVDSLAWDVTPKARRG